MQKILVTEEREGSSLFNILARKTCDFFPFLSYLERGFWCCYMQRVLAYIRKQHLVVKSLRFYGYNLVIYNCTCMFYLLLQTKLPSRPTVSRGSPLTQQQWSKHMDSDGKIKDIDKLKDVIFRGVSK